MATNKKPTPLAKPRKLTPEEVAKFKKSLPASSQREIAKGDELRKSARAKEKAPVTTSASNGNGTTKRSGSEYFSGKEFDKTQRRAAKKSGIDD